MNRQERLRKIAEAYSATEKEYANKVDVPEGSTDETAAGVSDAFDEDFRARLDKMEDDTW